LLSAVLLIAVGTLLLVPRLGAQAAAAGGPVSNWVEGQFGGFAAQGLGGQFLLGLLLGAVWSPCVGPTLGAASILAAKGENLGQVALTMIASASVRPFRSSPLGSCRAKPCRAGAGG
jgi:cytochrome c biogenesis protein CcdA